MKFTLEINLGNEAMQTFENIEDALHDVLNDVGGEFLSGRTPQEGQVGLPIRDRNGNTVGKWEVTA